LVIGNWEKAIQYCSKYIQIQAELAVYCYIKYNMLLYHYIALICCNLQAEKFVIDNS